MGLIPRRHRSLVYKVLLAVPLLWLMVVLIMYSDSGHQQRATGERLEASARRDTEKKHHQEGTKERKKANNSFSNFFLHFPTSILFVQKTYPTTSCFLCLLDTNAIDDGGLDKPVMDFKGAEGHAKATNDERFDWTCNKVEIGGL